MTLKEKNERSRKGLKPISLVLVLMIFISTLGTVVAYADGPQIVVSKSVYSPIGQNVSMGAIDVPLLTITLKNLSGEGAQLIFVAFNQVGSASNTDISYARLCYNDIQIGPTMIITDDGYLGFNLTDFNVMLPNLDSMDLTVKIDLSTTAKAGNTIVMEVSDRAQIIAISTISGNAVHVGGFLVEPIQSDLMTINAGALIVQVSDDTPEGELMLGQQPIFKFVLVNGDEGSSVTSITLTASGPFDRSSISQIYLRDGYGNQIGSNVQLVNDEAIFYFVNAITMAANDYKKIEAVADITSLPEEGGEIRLGIDSSDDITASGISSGMVIYSQGEFPLQGKYLTAPGPKIDLIFPNGGEQLTPGETVDIQWKSGRINNVTIQLYNYHGPNDVDVTEITLMTPADNESYSWTIPFDTPPGDKYKLFIGDTECLSHPLDIGTDSSDDYFSIKNPSMNYIPIEMPEGEIHIVKETLSAEIKSGLPSDAWHSEMQVIEKIRVVNDGMEKKIIIDYQVFDQKTSERANVITTRIKPGYPGDENDGEIIAIGWENEITIGGGEEYVFEFAIDWSTIQGKEFVLYRYCVIQEQFDSQLDSNLGFIQQPYPFFVINDSMSVYEKIITIEIGANEIYSYAGDRMSFSMVFKNLGNVPLPIRLAYDFSHFDITDANVDYYIADGTGEYYPYYGNGMLLEPNLTYVFTAHMTTSINASPMSAKVSDIVRASYRDPS